MNNPTATKELKLMSNDELLACGIRIPSLKQLSDNMDKRLKKIRGEEISEESFLVRHNYKANSGRGQA